VEALSGVLFVLVFHCFGVTLVTPVYWLFVATLIVITFIDIDHQIIPDVISLPGIILGFLLSFAVPWLTWQASLLGILLGGGSLYFVAKMYYWVTHVDGMGGGDVKLLAMIGAFLGWKAILPVIFLGSFLGVLVGVPLMLHNRAGGKFAIPFGPFLATGAVIYLLFGNMIIAWYISVVFPQ
jgi:leader peptidase (prepilin peptidase)/N-methyltransferase